MRSVVDNGNCSGCGGCAALSPHVSMRLDEQGFLRPVIDEDLPDRELAKRFDQVCPGIRLVAPAKDPGSDWHTTFGRYTAVWQGYAIDEEARFGGSSGGVLTALSTWLIESGRAGAVTAAAVAPGSPRRTIPVTLKSRADALGAAGSRYAPVGVAADYRPSESGAAFVGKPCEVAAAAKLDAEAGSSELERAPKLSFLCAGTPSQFATDRLISELRLEPEELIELRYRGNGWPGRFTATTTTGGGGSLSYEESWGNHLGRALQPRCKICPDGTGEFADVAVGDFWTSDADGYPSFDDAGGNSVIIARTIRGRQLVEAAERAGVLRLEAVDLDDVERMQPLQRDRRRTLAGRLFGQRLAGRAVPTYRGFGLLRALARRLRPNIRAARGSLRRSRSVRSS